VLTIASNSKTEGKHQKINLYNFTKC